LRSNHHQWLNTCMDEDRYAVKYLLLATAVSIVISFLPIAENILYPFKLFVTFIHEGGHALAAIATFGDVQEIRIFSDTSGLTFSRGGFSIIIASAGYLTSTIFGAVLLLFGRNAKYAKGVIFVVAFLMLGLTFLFMKGFFGWIVGLIIVAVLGVTAFVASPRVAHFFLNFLAVQCCLNALYDLRVLFELSATTREASDAMNMQRLTLIPAVVWASLWLLLSAGVLWIALKQYFKVREKNEEIEIKI
jgi:Peptidase M50B-like